MENIVENIIENTRIFEENAELIKSSAPDLDFEALKGMPAKNCAVETAKNGLPTLTYDTGEGFIRLHSAYDPHREAELIAEDIIQGLNYNAMILLYGIGLGYRLNSVLDRVNEGYDIVVIEPDPEIFACMLKHVAINKNISKSRFVFLVGMDDAGLSKNLSNLVNMGNIYNIQPFSSRAYGRIFERESESVRRLFLKEIEESVIRRNTMVGLSDIWFENQMKNVKYLYGAHDAKVFKGALKGRPAVLVASGPSLNKNVSLLKEIQGRVFICCAYTSLRVLERAGVSADMMFAIDGRQIVYPHDERPFDEPLFTALSANTELLRAHTGRKIFSNASTEVVYQLIFGETGEISGSLAGGESVAHHMINFLRYAGASRVIFLGLDLALSDDKNHADGTYYDGRNRRADDIALGTEMLVDDNFGGKIPTTNVLSMFLTGVNKLIEQAASDPDPDSETYFVNATEGGAKIQGAEFITFREAIDKYCRGADTSLGPLLDGIYGHEHLFARGRLENTAEMLENTLRGLRDVMPVLEDACECAGKFERMYRYDDQPDAREVDGFLRRLGVFDGKISAAGQELKILSLIFQNTMDQLCVSRRHDEGEGPFAAKQTRLLYEGLKKSCLRAIPLVEETLNELEGLKNAH